MTREEHIRQYNLEINGKDAQFKDFYLTTELEDGEMQVNGWMELNHEQKDIIHDLIENPEDVLMVLTGENDEISLIDTQVTEYERDIANRYEELIYWTCEDAEFEER